MTQASCKSMINISADAIWQVISSEFGAPGQYLAGVSPVRLTAHGLATCEPDGIPASEAEPILESAMPADCLALKQFMER